MGLYVAIDGPDGCGKSTQARRLTAWLEASGHAVVHLREPGSTPVGESLRELLLSKDTGDLDPLTEALVFTAARREMIVREVAPALAAGNAVVAERCFVATMVYQGLATLDAERRVPIERLTELSETAHDGLFPDLVVVLDVDATTSAARVRRAGELDRIERRDPRYHERVRSAYLELARPDGVVQRLLCADGPSECVTVIDGTQPEDVVHAQITAAVGALRPAGGDA